MRLYLDASLLVTLFTREPERPLVREWLSRADAELSASEWVATEVSSAFARKARMGAIGPSDLAAAHSLFRTLWSDALTIVPIRDSQFRLAARFCATDGVVVRAGDALHLAIAEENGMSICTRDRGMANAAKALGLDFKLVANVEH